MAGCEHPLSASQLRSLRRGLLRWYDQHRRDLPWRRDRDPYRVWVSEIMLQQTRVAAVLEHYARFMKRFPTVQSLAAARGASVLAVWSGLGYYHRARRMHQAAKVIARERRGEFPRSADDWLTLPGIGRYTAAAIASIAFEEAVAVVDGNVERVLQRLFGAEQSREQAWWQANALLDRKRPGDFNQAMMELGATVCTPRAPKCLLCPLNSFCQTRGVAESVVSGARKIKELHYALAQKNDAVLLVRRSADASLMAGMWELPELSAEQVNGDAPFLRLRHSITDTDYRVAVFAVGENHPRSSATDARWFTRKQCERLPLTGLARKILGRAGLQACVRPRRKDRSDSEVTDITA
jgi:A/G-specific adenine glycosylase